MCLWLSAARAIEPRLDHRFQNPCRGCGLVRQCDDPSENGGTPTRRITGFEAAFIKQAYLRRQAIVARYRLRMIGICRSVYVVTAVVARRPNFFVFLVQPFQKVPALRELAPAQSAATFVIVQLEALIAFAALAVAIAVKFRVEPFTRVGDGHSP